MPQPVQPAADSGHPQVALVIAEDARDRGAGFEHDLLAMEQPGASDEEGVPF